MTVGTQLTSAVVDQLITNYAVAMRDLMEAIQNLSNNVNSGGNGIAVLEAAGYSPTDATTAENTISVLNNVAQLYFGTVNQPASFNFNNDLAPFWGGR